MISFNNASPNLCHARPVKNEFAHLPISHMSLPARWKKNRQNQRGGDANRTGRDAEEGKTGSSKERTREQGDLVRTGLGRVVFSTLGTNSGVLYI
jgi:hypothetical protein